MKEEQVSGKYSLIVTEKNGETVVQIPDLSIIEKGKDFEEAYRKAKEGQERVLEKYISIGQSPPEPRSVTLPVFAYKFVFIAMIIALTAAFVTTINVTLASYGKYSPKTIFNEIDNLKETLNRDLKYPILNAVDNLNWHVQGYHNVVLGKPSRQSSYLPGYPKAGAGVDGIKAPHFGIYTDNQENPWWEVNLQGIYLIKQIKIYNPSCCKEGSIPLEIFLSKDHKKWRKVYHNDDKMFGSIEGFPLSVLLNDIPAKWIRLQIPDIGSLRLEEVEVYGRPVSKSVGNDVQEQNESQARK